MSPTTRSPRGCWRPLFARRLGRGRVARRSASAISCRSSRPGASAEGLHLFHDPRKRQCALASVTSFTIVDDVIVRIDYAEPAGATPKGAVAGA